MGVTLSIENAPDDVVERLRWRAARREHSLEDELLDIITEAAGEDVAYLAPAEVYAQAVARNQSARDEVVAMIREDRDRADGGR